LLYNIDLSSKKIISNARFIEVNTKNIQTHYN